LDVGHVQVGGGEQAPVDGLVLVLAEDGAELVGEAAQDGQLVLGPADPHTVPADPLEGAGQLPVLLHGRPEAVAMEAVDVELGLLPGAAGHHRLALVVHVQHQPGGLPPVVAEQLLEHEHHIRHQVDGVVPDDHHPGDVRLGDVVVLGGALAHRGGRAHAAHGGASAYYSAMPEPTFRPVTAADRDDLARFLGEHRWPFHVRDLDGPSTRAWWLERDGRVAGLLKVEDLGSGWDPSWDLRIAEDHRGGGLGTAAVRWLAGEVVGGGAGGRRIGGRHPRVNPGTT